jgi:hypothetical protein
MAQVRYVPQAALSKSSKTSFFDHLVGAGEQRWRHCHRKRLGCL